MRIAVKIGIYMLIALEAVLISIYAKTAPLSVVLFMIVFMAILLNNIYIKYFNRQTKDEKK
jgi:hypothetical protein